MSSPLARQVEDWSRGQCDGWLAQLYGEVDRTHSERKHLPPTSVQSQLVTVLSKVLLGNLAAGSSVEQTAALVLSHREPGLPFMNLQGMCLQAAESTDDEGALRRLADWLVALAHLPDAVNATDEDKIESQAMLPDGTWGDRLIKSGDFIELENGRLWRDLPGFSMNITENTQGPEPYTYRIRDPDTPATATAKWRNLNVFIALIIVHPHARDIRTFTPLASAVFKTFVMALEYERHAQGLAMHVPAATQIMRIAGQRLAEIDVTNSYQWPAGRLWADSGGAKAGHPARFAFWRDRLAGLEQQT